MNERKFKVIQEDGNSYLVFGTQKILLSFQDIVELHEDLEKARGYWIREAIREMGLSDDGNEDDDFE